MMVFIVADHRGFELKNQLIEYLQNKNIRVQDMGNYRYDPEDDYPLFASKISQVILQQKGKAPLGIAICGSGVGVSIVVNRMRGIRGVLGFDVEQVKHSRENDHANILVLPSDYISLEKAESLVDSFLEAQPKQEEKYLRRIKQMDE